MGRFLLIFGLVWLLVGVPFTLVGIYSLKKEQNYNENSAQTSGTVVDKKIRESRDSDNRVSLSYYLKYRFVDDLGEEIEAEDSVVKEFYEKTNSGDQVTVQYIPKEAAFESRIADGAESDTVAGWLFTAMGGICVLIGSISLFYYVRNALTVRNLIRDGRLTEGTVIRVVPGSLTINNVIQYKIHYKYHDHYGREHNGISAHMPPEEAEQWSAGDKGKIRFHKDQVHKSLWVGH